VLLHLLFVLIAFFLLIRFFFNKPIIPDISLEKGTYRLSLAKLVFLAVLFPIQPPLWFSSPVPISFLPASPPPSMVKRLFSLESLEA